MRGTIYTDPFSGTEVMLLEVDSVMLGDLEMKTKSSPLFGVAYDPRKAADPIPWRGGCRHCSAGRQRGLSVHTRREIRMLLTRKTRKRATAGGSKTEHSYSLPTNGKVLTVVHWQEGDEQHARISGGEKTLRVIGTAGKSALTYAGDRAWFQSPIMQRCLRFLFSERTARPEEVAACARPLAEKQLRTRKRRGYRNQCDKIDWGSISRASR